jgi:release factor glutamine methyltransferase
MTNSKELFNYLVGRVSIEEDKSEIESIVYLLLEKKLGLSKTDIAFGKGIESIDVGHFDQALAAINKHAPIQYILGESDFYGRTFKVNPSVLIPRPETELLVYEIKNIYEGKSPLRILDIGTGSGCLAITLTLEFPQATVHATEVSNDALLTAKKNSAALGANVQFHLHDILQEEITFGHFDLIVSNPPYISEEEKVMMQKNVLNFEPHLALFAPSSDPLAFYRAIAAKGKNVLAPGGCVWVEINERFGNEVMGIFSGNGYGSVHVVNDLDNKNRIVTGIFNQ